MITIRPLTEQDITHAVALQAIPWPSRANAVLAENDMRGGLTQKPGLYGINFIVAVMPDDRIVGMGGWNIAAFAGNTYGLCWAVVHPAFRSQGINTLMLDDRLQRIRAFNKAPSYDVITRTWDNPLYRSRGFVPGFKQAMQHKEGKCMLLAHFEV